MGSLALALKYRPKVFSDLVGQETISQTLSMALDKDRIVHAYLFSGLRGSGKTSSARIFARALECEKGPTSTPCGECATCVATLDGKNIDIIEMDAASNRSIDSIRDLIEQTKYVPTMSRYKIFIIDEVHMLTKEAFNALLKTLEEPPAYVKFILATTDPLKLPATILSRTQHFRFKKIPHKAIIAHLEMILEKEGVGYEKGALDIIARSGGGSLRDTLTLTDQAINYCDKYLTIDQVTQMLGIVDPKSLRDFFSSIMHDDEQGVVRALEILGEYECEMIIDEMLLFLKDMLLGGSKEFSLLVIDRFLGILSQAKSLLNLNPDGAFVLLLMSLKMREAMKLQEISEAIKNLESSIALESTFSKVDSRERDSVLGRHSADFGDSRAVITDKVTPTLESPKSYESPTATPRILEADNQGGLEKSAENQNQRQSEKVDSSNEAFSSSLRENPQGFSWQSTKTQSLESTFDKNAELQKVDSKKNAQSLNTPQNKKAEVVFDNHAAGGRIFLKKHRLTPSGLPCFDEKANAQNLESTFCTSHTSKPSALSFALLSAGLMGVVALSLLGYMWHSTPAMLGFAFVCIAAVLDVVANLLLKASNGFSKLGYGLGAVAVVIGAFYLLMLALDSMELAVAYSSWGAIGIIGTIAGGRILFGERLNAIGYVGVVLVIAAVGLLHEII